MSFIYYPTVKEETKEPIGTHVTGSIPSWVEGSLYRNGPGMYQIGDDSLNHLFDGMAKVHKFRIKDGQVTYQSRFLESETYKANTVANRIVVTAFGTIATPDPCQNIFQRMLSRFSLPKGTDNTNVNVYPVGDALYAVTESNIIRRVDKNTLETMDTVDISALVTVNSATAHPHIEKDGTVYNLGMMYKEGKYAIIKMTPTINKNPESSAEVVEKAEIVGTVSARWKMKPGYFHSFGVTENYFVMIENPLVMNVLKLMTCNLRGKAMASAMEWLPKNKSLFYVMDKRTGAIVNSDYVYETDALFVFHHANAYEKDGTVVVDVSAHFDGFLMGAVNMKILTDPTKIMDYLKDWSKPEGRRYIIPITGLDEAKVGSSLVPEHKGATAVLYKDKKIKLQHQLLCQGSFEFPRINYAYNGKEYRYIYAINSEENMIDSHKLVRVDTDTGDVLAWKLDGYFVSEPVFVANPEAKTEDDGVVLSIIVTPNEEKKPFMLVLDGTTMAELARAEIDAPVHRDFHGEFLAE